NRQIGWLVVFSLLVAGGVFTAGFAMGARARPAPVTAVMPAVTVPPAPAVASAPAAAPADPAQATKYTYDHVLTAPAAQIDDPTLRLIATAAAEGGGNDAAK